MRRSFILTASLYFAAASYQVVFTLPVGAQVTVIDSPLHGPDVSARYLNDDTAEERPAPHTPARAVLAPQQTRRRRELRACLNAYAAKPPAAAQHSPWTNMHALLAYGVDAQVVAGGQRVNAIGWLCWNRPCRGQRLFSLHENRLLAHEGPGLQGHCGQFLAMLAQARVRASYPMKVDGRDFTVADLVRHEQRTCNRQTELTFKLLGLAFYLDSDATWVNESGETWSVARLIEEELQQPVVHIAPCGGTHRLMGLSYAVHQREREGAPVDGPWHRARKYLHDYQDYAFMVQNPDGSFSTEWFRARGAGGDLDRRLQTTGHILEWLTYSLSTEELTEPRVTKSVDYLTRIMLDDTSRQWAAGPLGHALHALALYDARVFGSQPDRRTRRVAERVANQPLVR